MTHSFLTLQEKFDQPSRAAIWAIGDPSRERDLSMAMTHVMWTTCPKARKTITIGRMYWAMIQNSEVHLVLCLDIIVGMRANEKR